MTDANAAFQPDSELIERYVGFLDRFHGEHRRQWEHRLLADREAAMCEATFWEELANRAVDVQPHPETTGDRKTPDFQCRKNAQDFYVEVTCIHIETVTRKTGLSLQPGIGSLRLLTKAIQEECHSKTRQCADLDAPCLLGIGTFHFPASYLCIERRHLEEVLMG